MKHWQTLLDTVQTAECCAWRIKNTRQRRKKQHGNNRNPFKGNQKVKNRDGSWWVFNINLQSGFKGGAPALWCTVTKCCCSMFISAPEHNVWIYIRCKLNVVTASEVLKSSVTCGRWCWGASGVLRSRSCHRHAAAVRLLSLSVRRGPAEQLYIPAALTKRLHHVPSHRESSAPSSEGPAARANHRLDGANPSLPHVPREAGARTAHFLSPRSTEATDNEHKYVLF